MPESGYEVIRKYTAQARNSKTVPFFLGDLDVLHLPEIAPSNGTTHAWHLFAPAFDFDRIGKSRKQVMAELADKSIGTQVHYIPLYRQPFYREDYSTGVFDGAETYLQKTFSIPMYYGLKDNDAQQSLLVFVPL